MRGLLLVLATATASAQGVHVPHKAEVAGIVLTIRDDARREIQADVDALLGSPKYFNLKVERAKTYFPVIEKVLKEERVPDDVKFLVLQESALIADAVSVSNAVGYWQFKDYTAAEMGLRIDSQVDERMNIVSSTRAAAGYLKKNNYYFNNWLMAVQAYQMGAGAAMDAVGDRYNGARHMEVNSETYWYVKKFLAHKFAYEGAVKGQGKIQVRLHETASGLNVRELAAQLGIEAAELKEYNKWIRNDRLPSDKSYVVVVPSGKADEGFTDLLVISSKVSRAEPATAKANPRNPDYIPVERIKRKAGLRAIVAQQGDTWSTLASDGSVVLTDLLRFNDVEISDPVIEGESYFLQKKRRRADAEKHIVQPGDGWWQISQLYGVREARLRKFNQAGQDGPNPVEGSEVRLRPGRIFQSQAPVQESVRVEPDQKFEWDSEESSALSTTSKEEVTFSETALLPRPSGELHTVKKGETLYSIAGAYQLSPTQLANQNNMGLNDTLQEGQVLKLHAGAPDSRTQIRGEDTEFHDVAANDTLYSIARMHDITVSELMEWNSRTDFTISVGERLRVRPRAK